MSYKSIPKKLIKYLLDYINIDVSHKVGKTKFRIPILSGYGLLNLKDRERWVRPLLKNIIHKNSGVVIDVGVNVGQTLLKVASIDKGLEYYGFEPNIQCAAYVQRLIEKNKLARYFIFPFGLGENESIFDLYLRKGQTETASIIKGFRPDEFYSTSNKVLIKNGDDVVSGYIENAVSLIKIDVEGAELEVIKGLINTIKNDRPFILIEVLPNIVMSGHKLSDHQIKQRNRNRKELTFLLEKLDYNIYQINSIENIIEKTEQFQSNTSLDKSNYLIVPVEKGYQIDVNLCG